MQSIVAWKDIRIAVCFVVAFAACGYEPPGTDGSTSGSGGTGADHGNASSSSSGKGGAASNASSSSGKGGDTVSSSSSDVATSSSSGDVSSSSGSGPSSSSSSSGNGGIGTVACGGGTECTPILDTYGCCVFASSAPYCRNPGQCMMSPTFYCDGREDCGGAWCCLGGNNRAICDPSCNTAFICNDDMDCPSTAPVCKLNTFGPIGQCVPQ